MTVEQGPTNKLLCYYVRHYLVNTVSALELLQDTRTCAADKQKCLELATKDAKTALETANKLFEAICILDPGPIQQ
jgi:hypothetical protein